MCRDAEGQSDHGGPIGMKHYGLTTALIPHSFVLLEGRR